MNVLACGRSIVAPVPTRKVGNMEQSEGTAVASKKQERIAFLLLTAVIFPLAAVLIVAGYGFLVWMWQVLFAGPPTGP
ncbi:periplasmic nitrate reductase, NapE protein [Pseudoxanthomonas sp. PXM02]|jgi:nitrate reductase NapE|uniref:periplasmic nitrate reductase, NapE protein n=1 Tax=Pseudoxanthomonas sp. PXM02 TaxID=2769294 RepID=UPI001CE0DBFD|nr:periplasmic nitrate reductase, NapE protein [Pseudoxanthomonas sp. PXM02]